MYGSQRHCACVASGRLIDELRVGVDVETHPGELDTKQITRLHQLLHEAKFKDPDGSHLSPAGCHHWSITISDSAASANWLL